METPSPSGHRHVARLAGRPVARPVAAPAAPAAPTDRANIAAPPGRQRRRVLPAWAALLLVVGVMASYVAFSIFIGVGALLEDDHDRVQLIMRAGTAIAQLLTFLLIPVVVLAALRYPLRVGLSLRGVNGRLMLLTVATWPALIGLAQAVAVLAQMVLPEWGQQTAVLNLLLAAGGWPEFLFVLLVAAAVPALCEECLFRGAFQTALSYRIGWVPAMIAPALLFMLVHLDPAHVLSIMVLSFYLGLIAIRSGSLLYGMLLHLLNNVAAISLGLFAVEQRDVAPQLGAVGIALLLSGVGVFVSAWLWLRLTYPPVVPGPTSALSPATGSPAPVGWRPVPLRPWRVAERLAVAVVLLVGLGGNFAVLRGQGATIVIPDSAESWSALEQRLLGPQSDEADHGGEDEKTGRWENGPGHRLDVDGGGESGVVLWRAARGFDPVR